jgi:peptidoglycan/LPS O-acetylase OafA/YrhL
MSVKDVGEFFIRRIFRIYPLHLFVLAVLVAFWLRDLWLSGAPPSMQQLTHLGIVAVLLQPYLIQDLNWNPVSWSIGVELACYALFPFAILVLRRMNLVASLAALVIAALYERHVHSELIWGWHAIARGLAGFALGMMVQQMTVLCRAPSPRTTTRIELGAAGFMLLAIVLRDLAVIPLLGALLIYGLAAERGAVSRILSGPVWFWLGQISFSVYLLHPTVITLDAAIPSWSRARPRTDGADLDGAYPHHPARPRDADLAADRGAAAPIRWTPGAARKVTDIPWPANRG